MGVEASTVSRIVDEILPIITSTKDQWIKFPVTQQELDEKKLEFRNKGCVIPDVIGVIDCTHVYILKPTVEYNPWHYIGRPNKPTINVQATVDANERFTSVDSNVPGSVHDARIYRNSVLYDFMSRAGQAANCVLLGDEGYPISPWLLAPYRRRDLPNLQPHQINFNEIFTRERIIVERVFGIMKKRFPICAYKIRFPPPKCAEIIMACCILHNIAKYLGDPDFEGPYDPNDDDDDDEDDDRYTGTPAVVRQQGQDLRERLATQLQNYRVPRRP